MTKRDQNKDKTPSAHDLARGHFGKSYANELFAQVDNFFYEFGISKPPTRSDESKE